MEWRQGFTPKEHFEMDMQSRLLIDQHAWQAEQSLLADKRHDQSMKIAMDSMKTAMRGAYLGAIATILASALAVWATFKGQSPPPTVNVVIPPASATK